MKSQYNTSKTFDFSIGMIHNVSTRELALAEFITYCQVQQYALSDVIHNAEYAYFVQRVEKRDFPN